MVDNNPLEYTFKFFTTLMERGIPAYDERTEKGMEGTNHFAELCLQPYGIIGPCC